MTHRSVSSSVAASLPNSCASRKNSQTLGAHLGQVDYMELPDLNHFTIVDRMDRADDPVTARMLAHMG